MCSHNKTPWVRVLQTHLIPYGQWAGRVGQRKTALGIGVLWAAHLSPKCHTLCILWVTHSNTYRAHTHTPALKSAICIYKCMCRVSLKQPIFLFRFTSFILCIRSSASECDSYKTTPPLLYQVDPYLGLPLLYQGDPIRGPFHSVYPCSVRGTHDSLKDSQEDEEDFPK